VDSNWAHYIDPGWPKSAGAGKSMIVDYQGRLLARHADGAEGGVSAALNIQSLRHFRENVAFGARTSYLPNDIFRLPYEQGEIWPKNLLLNEQSSFSMNDWNEHRLEMIERRRDIYTPSGL
jgi:hypothetical protein